MQSVFAGCPISDLLFEWVGVYLLDLVNNILQGVESLQRTSRKYFCLGLVYVTLRSFGQLVRLVNRKNMNSTSQNYLNRSTLGSRLVVQVGLKALCSKQTERSSRRKQSPAVPCLLSAFDMCLQTLGVTRDGHAKRALPRVSLLIHANFLSMTLSDFQVCISKDAEDQESLLVCL